MKTIRFLIFWAAIITTPHALSANMPELKPPPEPPIENEDLLSNAVDAYCDWRTGLVYREFDLNNAGNTDYMTARRARECSQDKTNGNSVIIELAKFPLFYWYDRNHDGKFSETDSEMWLDQEEDGLNGNEILYKNPFGDNLPLEKAPLNPAS